MISPLSFLYHNLSPFTCLYLSSCISLKFYLSPKATHAMPTICFLSSSFSLILYPLSAFHLCVVTSPTITQLYSIKVASQSLRIIRPRLSYQERYSQSYNSLRRSMPRSSRSTQNTIKYSAGARSLTVWSSSRCCIIFPGERPLGFCSAVSKVGYIN